MTPTVVSMELNGKQLRIETGRMAKQADGAVLVSYGDSVVLVTAVGSEIEKPDIDFFPLTCDYVEKFYASGKIPGGFFKREGRPSEKDVLTSRLIDRPIRPMFAEGFKCETQIIATVMSMDRQNSTDVLAVTGASAALTISSLPFLGPMACVRVGRVGGSFIANPTKAQQEQSDIDLVVAGTRDAIVMVEGGAAEISEADTVAALQFAHQSMQPLIDLQLELARLVGKEKRAVKAPQQDETLVAEVKALATEPLREAFRIAQKKHRYERLAAIGSETKAKLIESRGITELGPFSKAFSTVFGDLKYAVMREGILVDRVRVDGRKTDEVRPITIELGVLPRAHGSALFTRGETQALVAVTLGTSDDAQRWDLAEGESKSTFMLHYNFPPFSTGEVKFLRSPGRREVGHGALAERSLRRLVPTEMEFPYTVRVVSEILESNGSSSMASVCGGSLAMFDAAVPFKGTVAGIAMGLIMEGDRYAILSDILGDEDHLGDMDFKVAGTRKGITGLQMDIKIAGLSMDIMTQALDQALRGRLHILGKMEAAINQPRDEMSPFAPRITTIQINTEKIRDVIGPGGKVIRGIVEKTGVKIDVDDSGIIRIASSDGEAAAMAERMIREITQEAEVGKLYLGQVKKITDFGAFVEIFPGTDGLIHISQLAHGRVNKVTDVVREGDEVLVRVLEVDKSGKIRLSRKDALDDAQG